MELLKWNQVGDEFVIALKQGKAIIREEQVGGKQLCKPHIEDSTANVIARFEPGFEDFETADAFISANLIQLDRVGTDDTGFREKLVSTIDACVSLLSEPNRAFHRQRLENIKRWFLPERADPRITNTSPTTDWQNYSFTWQQEGNRYQCDVPPHGKAVIVESALNPESKFSFGTAPRYRIQIEDSTGAILDCFVPSFDFLSAEAKLREILAELEESFVDEAYLNQLGFTLQICQRLLPIDSDLMQFVHLRYIESYLWEVLP